MAQFELNRTKDKSKVDIQPIKDGSAYLAVNEQSQSGDLYIDYGEKRYNVSGNVEYKKITTKGFKIIGWSGEHGQAGYYIIDYATEAEQEIPLLKGKKITLMNDMNVDSYCTIVQAIGKTFTEISDTGLELPEKQVTYFYVDKLYTNSQFENYNKANYNVAKKEDYKDNLNGNALGSIWKNYPDLGWMIKARENGSIKYSQQACLFINDYPELGTFDWFQDSYALEKDNLAQGKVSFAQGQGNKAYGKYSTVFGNNNKAGYADAVFGRSNDASGAQVSFVAGQENVISNLGFYHTVFGEGNKITGGSHKLVAGKFNKEKNINILELGYGSGNLNRKNIFEVDKDGKIYSNEMENMIDQKISIFTDTSNFQITNIEPSWVKYPYPNHQTNQPYNYNGGFGYYMTISSTCFKKNQRYLVEFCFQLKVTKGGTLDFRELITGTGTKIEVFRKQYQTLNLEASDSLQTCIVSCFINPDTKDEDITNIESYGIGIHESSTANAIFYHTNTKIRQIYFIDNLFNNYTKNLFIKLKDINIIEAGKQDIFSSENNKEYISYNDTLYLIPNKAVKNYEIINTYIPSEFTQYNSQKWKRVLKLNETNNNITISCPGLSGEQDVMISFNPEEGIHLDDYKKQKDVYDLIISNSYAKTIDGAVEIHILDSNIIDTSNTTECPILIKVV